jgi:hypothetical protein
VLLRDADGGAHASTGMIALPGTGRIAEWVTFEL